jgi:hypothetical protein
LTEEKGVQSKCDGATVSAAQNINTYSDALLYTGVTKEVLTLNVQKTSGSLLSDDALVPCSLSGVESNSVIPISESELSSFHFLVLSAEYCLRYLELDFFFPQQTIPMEKSEQISSRDFLKQT